MRGFLRGQAARRQETPEPITADLLARQARHQTKTPVFELLYLEHAIVSADKIDEWLRSSNTELLAPAPAGVLVGVEVSTHVDRAANDDPSCLEASRPPGPSASSRHLRLDEATPRR
jgi:hypothetical protein